MVASQIGMIDQVSTSCGTLWGPTVQTRADTSSFKSYLGPREPSTQLAERTIWSALSCISRITQNRPLTPLNQIFGHLFARNRRQCAKTNVDVLRFTNVFNFLQNWRFHVHAPKKIRTFETRRRE
ncbi:unnamed protein product [Dovyalis caffra]|uniref:Uncharacterized protein n=1 Tax=Dovyalis caffra TaxID=77055 RepID=A0AAV1RVL1_9ROSI|nr:unnamed protein product [Dovyalis caffra]